MSWAEAKEKWAELTGDMEGFYLSHQVRNNKKTAILAVLEPSVANKKRDKCDRMFILYRPNTGIQMKQEAYPDLKKKYKKVTADEAIDHWESQFKASSYTCSHAYWQGNCRRVNSGLECEIGLRRRTYHVLCGSVLNVWATVEDVLSSSPHSNSAKMQVVRLKTWDGIKLVGTLIPNQLCPRLSSVLNETALETFDEEFKEENDNGSKEGSDDDIQEITVVTKEDKAKGDKDTKDSATNNGVKLEKSEKKKEVKIKTNIISGSTREAVKRSAAKIEKEIKPNEISVKSETNLNSGSISVPAQNNVANNKQTNDVAARIEKVDKSSNDVTEIKKDFPEIRIRKDVTSIRIKGLTPPKKETEPDKKEEVKREVMLSKMGVLKGKKISIKVIEIKKPKDEK